MAIIEHVNERARTGRRDGPWSSGQAGDQKAGLLAGDMHSPARKRQFSPASDQQRINNAEAATAAASILALSP